MADIETRIPIKGVIVITNGGYKYTTNYRGVCYIPQKFDTLTIYKANYLAEKLTPREVKDSTYLIPNNRRIGEVTVWGDDRTTRLQENIERWADNATRDHLNSNSGVAFDLNSLFDRRARRDRKNLKKTRHIFNRMDSLDKDPIVNAYKMALERERLIEEHKQQLEERKAAAQKRSEKAAAEERKKQNEAVKEDTEEEQ